MSSYSKGMLVEFACTPNTPVKVINVYFDNQSQIAFDPDITKESSLICLNKFQMKVRENVISFRSKHCPASQDPICTVSADFTNSKVAERIKNSTSQPTTTESSSTDSSPQKELESKIASGQINPKNLNQTFTHQGRSYRVSDFDEVVGNNIENTFLGMTRDEAKQYTQNYLVAKTSVLTGRTPARAQVLSNLERMYGYIHGEAGDAELTKAIECLPKDNLTTIADVLSQVTKSTKISKCDPLRPGEHKVFEIDYNDAYATGNYLLRRTPEGNYQAILNVKFKPGAGATSPASMMERAKTCLNHASQFIKGPGGERLQLAVLSAEEIEKLPANQRPKQREISIESATHRSNSGAYAEDVDCPTITHEMLHLMGLCDEYEEKNAKLSQDWGCRVVTKTPSIMRSHNQAFEAVAGRSSVCNCSTETCKAIVSSNDEKLKKIYFSDSIYNIIEYQFRNEFCTEYVGNYKPVNPNRKASLISDKGNAFTIENLNIENPNTHPYYKISVSQFRCNCPANRPDCLEEKQKIIGDISDIGPTGTCPSPGMTYVKSGVGIVPGSVQFPHMLMTSKPRTTASLLHPNQFKKILAGNCPGIVDGYLECASWAYKGPGNTICNVPARCNDDSYYLGTPK